MKYVNPDSSHTIDAHSEDVRPYSQPVNAARTDARSSAIALGALAVGAGAIAFMAAWRIAIRSLTVKNLKVDHLEVNDLHIANPHRASSSMEESGGILRFELGASDVFENGLE